MWFTLTGDGAFHTNKFSGEDITDQELNFLISFLTEERKSRFEEVLATRTRHITIVLEHVIDTHNINAVIRSAECFGLQDVYIIDKETGFKPARNILRGSDKWMNIFHYKNGGNNTLNCIGDLKRKGYNIVAATPGNEQTDIGRLDISKPVAVVLGQEKEGISQTVSQAADYFTVIPMQGFTGSLNVSVAAAIILYELTHRMRKSDVKIGLSEEEKYSLLKRWVWQSVQSPEMLLRRLHDRKK